MSDQERIRRVAAETFAHRSDAKQFAFLWAGELVTGFYDAGTRRCHIITDHDEEALASIRAWLVQLLPEVFNEADDDDEGIEDDDEDAEGGS